MRLNYYKIKSKTDGTKTFSRENYIQKDFLIFLILFFYNLSNQTEPRDTPDVVALIEQSYDSVRHGPRL